MRGNSSPVWRSDKEMRGELSLGFDYLYTQNLFFPRIYLERATDIMTRSERVF